MLRILKHEVAVRLARALSQEIEPLLEILEVPKSFDHGHLSFPVFRLAKQLKKAPPKIAADLAETLKADPWPEMDQISTVGGFLNFDFKNSYVQNILLDSVFSQDSKLGYHPIKRNEKILVDFSSPNVAKQMSIGHLRATVIGQAICNLAESQAYEVIKLNHLGDWGTQFGKLAWAIEMWGKDYDLENQPIKSLTQLYVRFHEEAERNADVESQGAAYFKRLEEGDENLRKLWQKIVELSLRDYNRLWKLLGVKHDMVKGESFYNNRLKPTENLIEEKGLLVESEGAMVVELSDDKPPCLIRKSDGASLYASRDIASAIYRMEELGADYNLYVVGQDQTLHFQQVFEVLHKMNFPWADKCQHISFGMYRFKDLGRMSTRKGTVITLEDVLLKAIGLVKEIINEKNSELNDKDKVAEQVGVGAVIFNDLVNDRVKNVDFDWKTAVNFDGDTGPYVQYCAVRCKSIIRKYGKSLPNRFAINLNSKEEKKLIKRLVQYDAILNLAFKTYKPHYVANYLLDVCKDFNHFYHNNRVLGEEPEIESSRVLLIHCVLQTLEQGLGILNIQTPEEM